MTGSGGLSAQQVIQSRQQHGSNALEQQAHSGLWKKVLAGFGDPIIRILLIALAINALFLLRGAPWFETAGIAAAVFLATFISALSEYGSDAAFRRMQEEAARMQVRVRRDGMVQSIPADEVVVGDLVLLQSGERIAADGVLLRGELQVDQSTLTGESREITKTPGDGSPSDTKSTLLRGSVITAGEGEMEVFAVGRATTYGSMAEQVQEETRDSPMHLRLEHLAGIVSRFGIAAAVLVAAADLFLSFGIQGGLHQPLADQISHILHAVTLAVTVIVVAVPEGLPMMITVVLSANVVRMMRDHVLVRRLTGIETAGSLNILFTDKTGTLTSGHMTADSFLCGDGTRIDGISALQRGAPGLFQLVCADCRYNTAAAISGARVVGGNATDHAMLKAVLPIVAGQPSEGTAQRIPFDSAKKYAAVRLTERAVTLIRGAPELLLPHCTQCLLPDGTTAPMDYRRVQRIIRQEAGTGGRILLLAITDKSVRDTLPDGLTMTAAVVLRDPLRRETCGAVQQLEQAGIRLVMLTGDSVDTARAIARRAGLLDEQENGIYERSQIEHMSDEQLAKLLPNLRVLARAMPQDKTRLVAAAQARGLVTGMTGDGVNDAPALRMADIGFAMGSGTEVAQEAGDIVIADDNLASIARAVLYGRTIFKSIRKFLVFQLTMNVCAVGVSVVGPLIGIDTPVTVMQMLWVNLIMDTLAGLAFSGEPPLAEYMQEAPKKRDDPVLNRYMVGQISAIGCYTVALCAVFLWLPPVRQWLHYDTDPIHLLTAFFALFIFCSVFHAFNARTHRLNLLAHIVRNPLFVLIMGAVAAIQIVIIYFGGTLFRTEPLTLSELGVVAALAFTVIPVDWVRKLWLAARGKPRDF
ncbi:MAG: calcium-translocating P-type ATPase, PMCA-type [Eubacteriales bacterium]|nr:calcium-translocating P-type ATPase, PMCA-type [Eubacteriales bacterium]